MRNHMVCLESFAKILHLCDQESLFPTNSSRTVLGNGPTLASWYQHLMSYFDLSRLNESAHLSAGPPCELGCDGTRTQILTGAKVSARVVRFLQDL